MAFPCKALAINWGKYNEGMKNRTDLNLGEVQFIYHSSIISQTLGSDHGGVFIFICEDMTAKTSCLHNLSPTQAASQRLQFLAASITANTWGS